MTTLASFDSIIFVIKKIKCWIPAYATMTIVVLCFSSFAGTGKETSEVFNPPPYNSRSEYTLGVHANGGGSTGIVGMSADIHFLKKYALALKAGTGIYFNSYALEGRYYLVESSFSPYGSFGFARWSQAGSPAKLRSHLSPATSLGLVNKDGTERNSSISLSTLSLGGHYLSEYGFSIAGEFTALFSWATFRLEPWLGLSLGWYF